MYISPNGEIKVLKNVPLDNTYEHTIAWDSPNQRTKQANYFASKAKYTYQKEYYTRVKRGWLRIEQNPDDLYDCNYMMFRNTSFGNKWFYAFILSIEYINNATAQINFEIDVMQTWLPGTNMDYTPEPCFIERMHTPSDYLYENLVPEELNVGDDYVYQDIQYYGLNDYQIMVLSAGHPNAANDGVELPRASLYDNVFGQLDVRFFMPNQVGIKDCVDYLNFFTNEGKENNVLAVYMVPSQFVKNGTLTPGDHFERLIKPVSAPTSGTYLGKISNEYADLGNGYKPRNNKLYSYPYCRLFVSNQVGNTHEYKWELFNNREHRGAFKIVGRLAWKPGATIIPIDYRGFGIEERTIDSNSQRYTIENLDESISFNDFAVCAWVSDSYRAWWAQNGGAVGSSIVSGIASIGLGIAAGLTTPAGWGMGAIGSITGGVTSLIRTLGSIADAKHQTDKTHGEYSSSTVGPAIRNTGFLFASQCLRPDILRIYDDYFTKYGYACKQVRYPRIINRAHWTYIKTIGYNMNGRLNNEDMKKICEIYDNGITFWVDPAEVGNYNLDNNPIV